ncbi:MAG: hypothetical protein WBF93_09545 [Pirellulales bacterium]|nr:hypothetical protein [Pirellulales bacterium]
MYQNAGPMRACLWSGLALSFILSSAPASARVQAEEATGADSEQVIPNVTTVIKGLHHPCGIAVQQGTGEVYVSEGGRGRIVRVAGGKVEPIVTGFPVRRYYVGSTDMQCELGPLGLVFLGQDTLVVGGGGLADGADLLRVYTLPPRGESISAEKMTQSLGPIAAGSLSSGGEGDFYGVVATKGAVYVTCNGDDEKGWIARTARSDNQLNDLVPFSPTKVQSGVGAPMGIAVSKQGYLVVAQMGALDTSIDSALGFYDAVNGDLLAMFSTGLHDVVAVAYGPKSGRLYALDLAWGGGQSGGLYRIDATLKDNRPAVSAVKLIEFDKPTAMSFAADRSLYVTTMGTPQDGQDEPTGKLLRIAAGL